MSKDNDEISQNILQNLETHLPGSIFSKLKDHQVEGIKFILSKFNNGCILAHSMGLGKSVQSLACCHIILRETNLRKILFLSPLNVIENLIAEFKYWLPNEQLKYFSISDSHKTLLRKANEISAWESSSGVLFIGYEMFRTLISDKKNLSKKSAGMLNDIQNSLISADVVFCDEGQRIKNTDTGLMRALKKITCKRKIILTGFPIQNNLLEYWTMVDFVRPMHLDEKSAFQSNFEIPILTGQCIDSTVDEKKIMAERLHELHMKLDDCVHRMSHIILQESLPIKKEFVLFLSLTPLQKNLYTALVNSYANTFEFFCDSMKIFNHPELLLDYINRYGGNEWAHACLDKFVVNEIDNSIKMKVFFYILKESIGVGDRVLLFSHSLDTLTIIEKFLHSSSELKWIKNFNYFRLDGSTPPTERHKLIKSFNSNDSVKLFLISTKAGSLGTNLIGANRVVLFDVSWNPCHDAQAVCRVYRYGQKKCCFTYRLITDFTIERKIFNRQVSKQSLSMNVVDRKNVIPNVYKAEMKQLLKQCITSEQEKINSGEMFDDVVVTGVIQNFKHLLSRDPKLYDSFFIETDNITAVVDGIQSIADGEESKSKLNETSTDTC